MGTKRRVFSLVARIGAGLSLLVVGAPGCGDVESGNGFDEETSEIHNGTDVGSNGYGLVAVYHIVEDSFFSHWYTHPCTGTVLNPNATNNYLILTARHCVTPYANPNEGLDGPTLRPFGVRVSAELTPGPTPSAAAVQACDIYAPPSPNNGYLDLDDTLDMAIVHVCQPIPGLLATAAPNPLYMGSSASFDMDDGPAFDGVQLIMYGYGCHDWDDSSTAGILRRSVGHNVVEFDTINAGLTGYDYYQYRFSNGSNTSFLAHGDSGGPSYWNGPSALKVQIGVHNSSDSNGGDSWDVAVSRINNQWIGSVTGRFYIRPQDALNRALSRSGDQSGATVNAAATSGIAPSDLSHRQWFLYDFPTRHIYAPLAYAPLCLRRNGNTLQMQTCDSSTSQKWWTTGDNPIRTSDDYCLSGRGPAASASSPARRPTRRRSGTSTPTRASPAPIDPQRGRLLRGADMKTIGRVTNCVATALWLAAAPGCGDAETGDALEEESSAIGNGTEVGTNGYGVVAVYHKRTSSPSSAWYPHPCTGVVLTPSKTNGYIILTARHCVTSDPGNVDGPTLPPSAIKVSADVAPGQLPPANAPTACEVVGAPLDVNYLNLGEVLDMATVGVCQPIPGLSATANPLFMGSNGDLIGQTVTAYGYGLDENDATGGILRRATGLTIVKGFNGGATGYDYTYLDMTPGTNGAYLTFGDSGGPSFWNAPNALKVQVGVHKSYSSRDTAVSRITAQFIGGVVGRFYIRPQDAMTRALSRSSDQAGASVNAAVTANISPGDLTTRQWFRYDFPTRHIMTVIASTPTCLRRNGDNTLEMVACNSTAASQKWWVTLENTLRDSSGTSCLKRSGTSGAVVAPCSSTDTSQKWYFDTDSRVAGVY